MKRECEQTREVLGRLDPNEITYHAIFIEPGDIIFLVTDGVSDNLHDPAHPSSSTTAWVKRSEEMLERWIGDADDPVEVLCSDSRFDPQEVLASVK